MESLSKPIIEGNPNATKQRFGNRSLIDADRAPLGLTLLVKPEWTDLNYGTTYTVSYFLIGSQILFMTARGRPTLDDLERITAFERRLIHRRCPRKTPFVRIEDWSKLQAPSRGAREYYIRHLIGGTRPGRPDLHPDAGLFFTSR